MRIIVHIDMDAFYAAVESPSMALRDLPVAVGATRNKAKAEASHDGQLSRRKHGIRSALPISRAWRFAEAARQRGEPATVLSSRTWLCTAKSRPHYANH
jgi:nucleotidyltransferase/DNA polymerase involved in DNA repair